MEITIAKEKAGNRLDKFLGKQFPAQSRAFLKFQIKEGAFLVNGKIEKPSYQLKENDIVSFDEKNIQDQSTAKLEPNPEIKLDVIYEDGDVIVLNKPAGISVHPRQDKSGLPLAKESKSTLASALLAHYPAIASVGDNPLLRPGLVHRLDKDTSGVMIAAKNQKSFEWLKNQFKEKSAQKKYLALVWGRPKEDEGIIKTFLTRSKSDPSKQKVLAISSPPLESALDLIGEGVRRDFYIENLNVKNPPQSPFKKGDKKLREAVTEYKVIKIFKEFSLLEAYPKTGRLHQIRAHFAWLGNPVVGDKKYGPAQLAHRPAQQGGPADQNPLGLARQFLHAQELEITLPASPAGGPNGEKRRFFSQLPPDLQSILDNLDKTGRDLKD